MYLEERNVNVFEDKLEAYDFWKANDGYFIIITDGGEDGYLVENPENDFSHYEEIRELSPEVNFIQIIKYQSDDLFPHVDMIMYEKDFLERDDSHAV